jgi:hypothetical protein
VAEWTRVIEKENQAPEGTQHSTLASLILIIADLSRASKNRETISGAAATESLLIPASVEKTAPVEHFMEADGRK